MRDCMKQRQRVITLLILFTCFFSGVVTAEAEDDDQDIGDVLLEDISLGEVQNYWDELVTEYSGYLPEIDKISVYEFIKNKESFSLKNVLKGFVKFLLYELILNGKLLGLRSEEHTSELQSRGHLVCRLLLEKKTNKM